MVPYWGADTIDKSGTGKGANILMAAEIKTVVNVPVIVCGKMASRPPVLDDAIAILDNLADGKIEVARVILLVPWRNITFQSSKYCGLHSILRLCMEILALTGSFQSPAQSRIRHRRIH
jgi:hypothetical protein